LLIPRPDETTEQVLPLVSGTFLDKAQRYQLIESKTLTLGIQGDPILDVKVMDTLPNEPVPLLVQHTDILQSLKENKFTPQSFDSLPSDLTRAAYPYLILHDRFFPSIPELQDTWQDVNFDVVLIEDRRDLPRLLEMWAKSTLEPLQQLHCFYTMTELWENLCELKGQASLLKLDNLCLDEDLIFCLAQIDISPTETAHTLADLGLLWQSLLHANADTVPTALSELTQSVVQGNLQDIEALKDQLVAIADDIEAATHEEQSGIIPTTSILPPLALTSTDSGDTASSIEDDELAAVTDEAYILDEPEETTDMATMVLPMKLIEVSEAGQTHVGQQREHNEDAYAIVSNLQKQDGILGQKLSAKCLYILCDGMGGHAGGEVASRLAVETLQNYFAEHWTTELPSDVQIEEAIFLANQAIYDLNQAEVRSGSARMGTTLVLLLVQNTRAIAAHVGDSRLYRYTRRMGLQQLSVDHEVGQREIQRGIEPAIAYARPDAYQLTQALGPRENSELEPSISTIDFTEDTLLLLCSDGLTDNDLLETNFKTHIEPLLRTQQNLEEGINDLIDLANEVNGHDNISVIGVKLKVKPNLEKIQTTMIFNLQGKDSNGSIENDPPETIEATSPDA
jgi:protein phosphatase